MVNLKVHRRGLGVPARAMAPQSTPRPFPYLVSNTSDQTTEATSRHKKEPLQGPLNDKTCFGALYWSPEDDIEVLPEIPCRHHEPGPAVPMVAAGEHCVIPAWLLMSPSRIMRVKPMLAVMFMTMLGYLHCVTSATSDNAGSIRADHKHSVWKGK